MGYWHAVCGSSVDVLSLIDDGNNNCRFTLKTASGTSSGSCSSLYDACDGYAGSLELYATNPSNLALGTYKDPIFESYLDLMGLGSVTFIGGALPSFERILVLSKHIALAPHFPDAFQPLELPTVVDS